MEVSLDNIYSELKIIRTYLIKLGSSRRIGKTVVEKLDEADKIYKKFEQILLDLQSRITIKTLSEDEHILICSKKSLITNLYQEIVSLCSGKSTETSDTMAKFDFKVAISLLPVMDDTEKVTKQLIDGIEYYSSVLNEESKNELIIFVLKTRLSSSAKLKLNQSYNAITNLIGDMKNTLLCKKSSYAIQNKLLHARQINQTTDEFGHQISELFVDLTIAQAEGNTESYNILKKINEKQAIKSFVDGIRNRRVGTIIAARNISSLKEAIQSAKDEEVVMGFNNQDIMMMGRQSNNLNYEHRQPYRGKSNIYYNQHRPPFRNSTSSTAQATRTHVTPIRSAPRGSTHRYSRGGKFNSFGRGNQQHNFVRIIEENGNQYDDNAEGQQNSPSENTFFRD